MSIFSTFLAVRYRSSPLILAMSALDKDRYPRFKDAFPTEGRRKWKLRAAREFWEAISANASVVSQQQQPTLASSLAVIPISDDGDPYDNASGLGILIRTDYSNEDAWQVFCSKLRNAEKELVDAGQGADSDALEPSVESSANPDNAMQATASHNAIVVDEDEDDDDEEDEEMMDDEDAGLTPIFTTFNPKVDSSQALHNASNIRVLRLFNDIDIVSALDPPQGTKHVKPPNVLIDMHGLQEVYSGELLWIYDARSNVDQSVRLVNQRSDVYGTATGDSWRLRVSSLPELQVNLAAGAMKINFGGDDRWDFQERQRNLAEADIYPI